LFCEGEQRAHVPERGPEHGLAALVAALAEAVVGHGNAVVDGEPGGRPCLSRCRNRNF
jgi:hypothetical protein